MILGTTVRSANTVIQGVNVNAVLYFVLDVINNVHGTVLSAQWSKLRGHVWLFLKI